ncbi:DVU_1555 family C-GCAxxG-C-C protein [Maridesulfovibrio zosterae]|uniref:DVU_1555 family C-GCAxxG-C-C protein n=1 Tax=Maridesulfovibrio zosterae TaxID=82171 RepID=UPI000408D658|nr:DV_1555 family C-GCAxxG-C-C protein [Maridesulfovibrio zosterae]
MNDTDLRVMQLNGTGYCCAQIFILLCLDNMQRENPDLVRSAQGLCLGMGNCSGSCGILSGGICALGLYAGKGTDQETPDDKFPLLVETFKDWFQKKVTSQFGGIRCEDILGEKCSTPKPEKCGTLLIEAYNELVKILLDAGFDPVEGREESDGY